MIVEANRYPEEIPLAPYRHRVTLVVIWGRPTQADCVCGWTARGDTIEAVVDRMRIHLGDPE